MLGADSWSVEYVPAENAQFQIHTHWIVCNGGFLYENLNLIEWITDARNGDSPWIGGFYSAPAKIEGGVGGMGTPMVIV